MDKPMDYTRKDSARAAAGLAFSLARIAHDATTENGKAAARAERDAAAFYIRIRRSFR